MPDRHQDPILERFASSDTNLDSNLVTLVASPGSGSRDQVRALARHMQQGLLQDETRDTADDLYIGNYRVLDILGRGGMSTVYLAEHVAMHRRVAIKVLAPHLAADSRFVKRFYQEARVAASLDHPNIIKVHDVAGDGDLHYLVMEYVQGQTLGQLVEGGPLPVAQAVKHIQQAATALAYAHRHGVVHRDIKPDNLVCELSGAVKILDLGLARLSEAEDRLLTIHDNMLGTVDYMAPEQAEDSHEVDARADIYSLGCTLYYVLVGHPPFPNGTAAQRLMFHMLKQPRPVRELRPEVPLPLAEILDRCLAKSPEDRYPSADDVADALGHCLDEPKPEPEPQPQPEPEPEEPPTVAISEPEAPTEVPEPTTSSATPPNIRVTLRRLLAYRSRVAPDNIAAGIEAKARSNQRVAKTLARMENVVARGWLEAPPLDDTHADPNDVAEYLDNTLTHGNRQTYERLCVEGDTYLAELADCHQALSAFLKSPPTAELSQAVRQNIVDAGSPPPDHVSRLLPGLADRDPFVRQLTAESLGNLGPQAHSAIANLLPLVRDTDKKVQQAARVALRQIRPER